VATITPTVTYAPNGHREVVQVVWTPLASGDVGGPVELPGYSDRSVQIQATFGDGTITLQGCDETTPTNWHPLTDPQGNDIAKTAADLEQVTEITRHTRPQFTGTTGTAGTVILTARREL
jgi:hypothetical protein